MNTTFPSTPSNLNPQGAPTMSEQFEPIYLYLEVTQSDGTIRAVPFTATGETREDGTIIALDIPAAEELAMQLLVAAGVKDITELQETFEERGLMAEAEAEDARAA